jgi:hypothetical protein
MSVIAAVQILLAAVVLLFVDSRSGGPLLRPSLPKAIIN